MATTYGSLPTTNSPDQSSSSTWRKTLGHHLESDRVHWTILGLTMIDAACVLLQILYTFFHECQADPFMGKAISEWWLISFEVAEIISIVITCLFLVECALSFVAFGPRYYLPGTEHWKLHIFDIVGKGQDIFKRRLLCKSYLFVDVVVVSTFVLDIVLRGKEREVAG